MMFMPMPFPWPGVWLKPRPLSVTVSVLRPSVGGEADLHTVGLAVLDRVIEGFLDDPVEVRGR